MLYGRHTNILLYLITVLSRLTAAYLVKTRFKIENNYHLLITFPKYNKFTRGNIL